jgi:hypothetical protein
MQFVDPKLFFSDSDHIFRRVLDPDREPTFIKVLDPDPDPDPIFFRVLDLDRTLNWYFFSMQIIFNMFNMSKKMCFSYHKFYLF